MFGRHAGTRPRRVSRHGPRGAHRATAESLERRLLFAAEVVGRHVFYNNSFFDGRDRAAGAADDAAIATDKRVLLPGQTATFANYTGYSRGINGVMVDVRGLPGEELQPWDFDFVFTDASGADEGERAPGPRAITVRRGAGVDGSDRVTLTWADGDIRNRWIHVVVRPGGATGLAARDDFYVGNRVAETGDDARAAAVDAIDLVRTRLAMRPGRPAVDSRFDHNRDGRVNAQDLLIVRRHRSAVRIPLPSVADTPQPELARLRLVLDTGRESGDGVTSDPRVRAGVGDEEYLAKLLAGFDDAPEDSWLDVRAAVDDGTLFLGRDRVEAINGGPLSQGPHVLRLRAVDPRGNTSTYDFSFTYDTVAPTLALEAPPRGLHTTNFMIAGRATDPGAAAGAAPEVLFDVDLVDLDDEQADPDTGAFAYETGFDLDGTQDGAHTIRVSAVDAAGNISAPQDVSFYLLSRALPALPGPAAEPVAAHLPADLAVPPPPPGDFSRDGRAGGTGLATSRTRVILRFAPDATVGQVNELLAGLGALTVGTIPEARAVVIAVPDPGVGNFSGLTAALAAAEASPAVELAVQDVQLVTLSLPGPTDAADRSVTGWNNPAGQDPNPWHWDDPPSNGAGASGVDGNWGMEAIRAPQMWSLNDAAANQPFTYRTAVWDAGFNDTNSDGRSDHPQGDLANLRTWRHDPSGGMVRGSASVNAHGEHVAGIVGAVFHDGRGTAGVNPFAGAASPAAGADDRFLGIVSNGSTGTVYSDLTRILRQWPDLGVINYSMGYGWQTGLPDPAQNTADPSTDATTQQFIQREGLLARAVLAAFPRTIMVPAAGNNSAAGFPTEIEARWGSGFAWAGLGPTRPGAPRSPNVIVVESMDAVVPNGLDPSYRWQYTKSDFSNVGGDVSAPGGRILSPVGNNLHTLDGNGNPTEEFYPNYDTFDGTSMAAPHVTGLIGYLLKLEPDLTVAQIRRLVAGAAYTRATVPSAADLANMPAGVAATAPMIDAFAAAMGIDLETADPNLPPASNLAMQRALVDVDDGTRDGNRRVDPVSGAVYGGIAHADGYRGDGVVTMRDFRAWRDAYLQAWPDLGWGDSLPVTLDGPAEHFKKDLNFDGAVGVLPADPPHPAHVPAPRSAAALANAPGENVYPRYDFNGDGSVGAWFDLAPFKIDPDSPLPSPRSDGGSAVRSGPGFLRDIDVLADPLTWSPLEPDGYSENVTTTEALAGHGVSAGGGPWDTWAYLLENVDKDNPAVPAALRDHPDYLHSFDAHLSIQWNAVHDALDALYVTISSAIQGSSDPGWVRSVRVDRGRGEVIVTVPLWTGKVTLEVSGIDLEDPSLPADLGDLAGHVVEWTGLTFGQDKALQLPFFQIVDLGVLPGDAEAGSIAYGLNDHAEVVGGSGGGAFFWKDGNLVRVGPGGIVEAIDVNNVGEVLGSTFVDGADQQIWVDHGGNVRPLPLATASEINDAGVVVGATRVGDALRAARVGPGSTDVFGTFGGNNSFGTGINSLGQVVGWAAPATTSNVLTGRAFVSRSGTEMTPLLSPLNPVTHEPHTWTSQATDINDAGWVAGWYWSIWGYRALVWAPDGTVSDIAGSPNENSYAQSINNAGQVVGFVDPHAQGVRRYAFLAGPNRSYTNLNDALPAGSGWQLTEAFDINNRGEIVGRGVHDGQARAFLLTTVPAPTPRAAPAALSVASASGMPPSRRESPATGAPGSVTPGVPRVDTWLGVSLRAATAPLPRETATESLRSGTGVL